jgi:large subunit ribosomal protein L30
MTAKKKTAEKVRQIRVTLVRSLAKKLAQHRLNANGLGLRRIRQSVVIAATPENMGMVNNSAHMFRVEEV